MTPSTPAAAGKGTAAPAVAGPTVAVYGLDLSLTATGFAGPDETLVIVPGKRKGLDRLRFIVDEVSRRQDEYGDEQMFVVEGPSYGSTNGHQHERGGLWWMVYDRLDHMGCRIAVAPPATLKRYATGRGGAGKAEVMSAAWRRLGYEGHDDNVSDALWLRQIGLAHIGHPDAVAVPQLHQDALAGVAWPEQVAA